MKRTLILCIIIIAAVGFILPHQQLLAKSSGQDAIARLSEISDALEEISSRVGPAVVEILAFGYGPSPGGVPTSSGLLSRQFSTGSGVILGPEGYIVTNAHVVAGAMRVQAVLATPPQGDEKWKSILKPRGKTVEAKILGIDEETDLAVLKIEGTNLPFLELGDSDELRQGQLVFAFGSPLGLENSVSLGVISSVARQLRPEDPMIYIQTDAPINPGNSGGPLVNDEGQVIGINTLIYSQSGGNEGIGFAAPSNIVKNVYGQIRSTGHVHRGTIGVHAQTITPVLAKGLNLPQDWGVILGDVYPDSPAEKAGLKVGDIILSLNMKPMENGRQLDVNIYRRRIGEEIKLDVMRGTERFNTKVTVSERIDDPERFAEMVSPEKNLVPELGILGLELDERIAGHLPNLRKDYGVVVAVRAVDAPFLDEVLTPGDVIYALNSTPIAGLNGLRAAISGLKTGDPIVLQIDRNGRLMYVTFELQ